MRGLVVALLLANLAYFGWMFSQQGEHTGKDMRGVESSAPPIVLLSELADEDPEPGYEPDTGILQQAVDEEPASDTQAAVKADACYTLGPFRELQKLREVIRSLKGSVLEASFRSRDEREQTMFWVYLAPAESLAAAKQTTQALREKRIMDSYIIAEGEKMHAISLGHFREKPRAYSLGSKIAGLGFDPVVEPVFSHYTIYWLDFRVPGDRDIDPLLAPIQLDKKVNQFDRSCT